MAIFALCISNYHKGEPGNKGITGTRRTRGTEEQQDKGNRERVGQENIAIRGAKGTEEQGEQGNTAIKGTGEQGKKGNEGTWQLQEQKEREKRGTRELSN